LPPGGHGEAEGDRLLVVTEKEPREIRLLVVTEEEPRERGRSL
jgi:hypothetical protein